LGRTSFRAVKTKRDYLNQRKSASWTYLSRLAAIKEFAFMKALYDHGFPVPQPIDFNRHCIVMELLDGCPLSQVHEVGDVEALYSELMDLIVRFACHGLIHCDFNEFNILLSDEDVPIVIDFPQMVSISHKNAEKYFERDVQCIRTFFKKRFHYESDLYPKFHEHVQRECNLDISLEASGFSNKNDSDLSADEIVKRDSSSIESKEDHNDIVNNEQYIVESFHSMALSSESSEEDHNEQPESLPLNDNHRYRPFRDAAIAPPAVRSNFSAEEIRERIKKSSFRYSKVSSSTFKSKSLSRSKRGKCPPMKAWEI
jgi:RIO kinase 2